MTQSESNKPRGPWILVVEDEAEFSQLVCEKLHKAGYRTLSVNKAYDAIRAISNQTFYCIIADCNLAMGSGDQVVMNARKDEKTLNFKTPIIMMSGAFEEKTLQKVKQHISGAFVKPFPLDDLVSKVNSFAA